MFRNVKIPLQEIRLKELRRCEDMGILRIKDQSFYDEAPIEDIVNELTKISCVCVAEDHEDMRKQLQGLHATRYIKDWSDHGATESHSHYLHIIQFLHCR